MILLIDFGSKKSPDILEIVDEFIDCELCYFNDFEESLLEIKTGIILSGAPVLITEQNPHLYIDRISAIFESKLPILGICFGHQIIGMKYGAMPSKMKEDRSWQLIGKLYESKLFQRLPEEFEMMEDHCECISIPPNFILTASSDVCVNEAMEHKTLPLFGVQFHPETSGNFGRIVIENFIKVCESLNETKITI